jgi:hypothetical protein
MHRNTLAVALVLASCLATGSLHADEKADAEQRFRAGVALQKVEDWDAAIIEFQASLRLYPTKSALFNLATALRATHRYVEALEALQQLQRDYSDELDAQMRTAAESLANELTSLTGMLLVAVNEPGADVYVDGAFVGKSPLADPIRLSVGDHRVDVKLDGFAPAAVQLNLASREEKRATITLRRPEPEPTPALPPTSAPPPAAPPVAPAANPTTEAPGSGLRTSAWVTTGTGIALLAAGTVTGVWTLTLDKDLESDCIREHCPGDRADDIDRLDRLAPTTTALLTVGTVATAAGVTLLAVDRRRRARANRQVRLVAAPQFIGASVGGTF